MNTGFLMIILTLLETGQMSAAFVNTQKLEDCEHRATGVRAILEGQNVPIKHLVCRSSSATFEPYSHGNDKDAVRHSYIISFDARDATVVKNTSGSPCEDAAPGKPIRYCATSAQKLLSEEN